jgi:hypothetical protein
MLINERPSRHLAAWYCSSGDCSAGSSRIAALFFFDLTDNKVVHDFKGKQLANIELAREHAIGIARELIRTKSTFLREPISDWSITVKDGKFQKLFSVPVSDTAASE